MERFCNINSKYKVLWEYADLLIELGGGAGEVGTDTPVMSGSAPVGQAVLGREGEGERERGGDEDLMMTNEASTGVVSSCSMPLSNVGGPSGMAWRGSTGRRDLSQRQLVLLREMLNKDRGGGVGEDEGGGKELNAEERDRLSFVNKYWR